MREFSEFFGHYIERVGKIFELVAGMQVYFQIEFPVPDHLRGSSEMSYRDKGFSYESYAYEKGNEAYEDYESSKICFQGAAFGACEIFGNRCGNDPVSRVIMIFQEKLP